MVRLSAMQGSEFDEPEFFRAVAGSGARALLIGRRALVVLGLPVLTADYDFWLHGEDIAAFNEAAGRSACSLHTHPRRRVGVPIRLHNDRWWTSCRPQRADRRRRACFLRRAVSRRRSVTPGAGRHRVPSKPRRPDPHQRFAARPKTSRHPTAVVLRARRAMSEQPRLRP